VEALSVWCAELCVPSNGSSGARKLSQAAAYPPSNERYLLESLSHARMVRLDGNRQRDALSGTFGCA